MSKENEQQIAEKQEPQTVDDLKAMMQQVMEDAKKQSEEILNNAKAEADKIIKAAKKSAKSDTEGTSKKDAALEDVSEIEAKMKEVVTVNLFKDNDKYADDVFVAVNGESFLIKRGIDVKVPRYVKEVLDNAKIQAQAAANMMTELADEYEKSLK